MVLRLVVCDGLRWRFVCLALFFVLGVLLVWVSVLLGLVYASFNSVGFRCDITCGVDVGLFMVVHFGVVCC